MNIDNINRLIDHLKKVPDKAFDMGEWFIRIVPENDPMLQAYAEKHRMPTSDFKRAGGYIVSGPHPAWAADVIAMQEGERVDPFQCNTVACIAGHAALLSTAETGEVDLDLDIEGVATEWLGLTDEQAHELFVPRILPKLNGYATITAIEAARVCEHLRDTGEVDWIKARVTPE